MEKKDREPLLVRLLLVLMIFEVPFFNLFLVASTIIWLCLVVLYKRRPLINIQIGVLILFITTYFAIDTVLEQSISYKIWYGLSVVLIYASGYYASFKYGNQEEQPFKLENSIALIANAYLCYVTVTMLFSVTSGQLAVSRNPLNLWTGSLRAATHYGTMLIFPSAYGIFLCYASRKRYEKAKGVVYIILSILFSILTASRTILIFVPIGMICAYYYNIKITGRFQSKHLKQLVSIAIIAVGIASAFYLNIFNFRTFLMQSQLGRRYLNGQISTISEDGRMVKILFLCSHLAESFWGGGYTRRNVGNLHNIYLNVYDLSGIIPFLLLIIFSFGVLKNICRLFKKNSMNKDIRMLIFLVYVLSFAQLLMEPVMESVPVFCWCLLYISGMIEKDAKVRSMDSN